MAIITAKWTGDGIFRMEAAMEKLAGPKRISAMRRAINHTGDKTFTAVKRTLSKQMGVSQKVMTSGGRALRKARATSANLTYEIISNGRAIRMKEFRWRKTATGITAYPWGNRKTFKSAFVIVRWGGNLYRRRTKKRFKLEALYGPNINKEIVKDATAAAFQATAAALVPRVEHEVRVITDGVVS